MDRDLEDQIVIDNDKSKHGWWIEDARLSRIPREDTRPAKRRRRAETAARIRRWRRYRGPALILLATLFFEVGFIAGRWERAQPITIRPVPMVTCPDGTVMEVP